MDDTVLKIALAGFMHDIGKLADRGVMDISQEYVLNNADLYQPFFNGKHTHPHALCTAAFIEQMKDALPPQLSLPEWGSGDLFLNLAAAHHKPETPLQWIVTVADRLSAGLDRREFEDHNQQVDWQDYRKTRLNALFERLSTADSHRRQPLGRSLYCYSLAPLSPESIFPRRLEEVSPKTNEAACQEYDDLFATFRARLDRLLHRRDSVEIWFEHFDSLMLACTFALPQARAGNVIPDVSLYDHARTTSALATALYLYHRDGGTLTEEAVRSYDESKFLFVTGDFYGIQDFIFACHGDVRKHRAKLLRGRSLQVSLFSELAADLICEALGLPFSSVVLNAAGKFTLIAPNTDRVHEAIGEAEQELNDWLIRLTNGENAIGVAKVEVRPSDLVKGKFQEVWDRLQKSLGRKKCSRMDLNRYAGPVEGYLDRFDTSLHRDLCPLCGKRPSSREAEDSSYVGETLSACQLCRDQVFLGTKLVKKNRLAILRASATGVGPDRQNRLLEPIFGKYQVAFYDETEGLANEARNGTLRHFWDLSLDPQATGSSEIAYKFINGYVPVFQKEEDGDDRVREVLDRESDEFATGEVKPLSVIAAKAQNFTDKPGKFCGVAALGILKADVDNLGILMSCGLPEESSTISRQATLSRQLNIFFAVYLPHLLKADHRFQDVYTVFAGGDDLFLIGPWNRTIELASVLREIFSKYVCGNSEITFSAGVCFANPHVPVDRIAVVTEHALEESKNLGKDCVTLFGQTASWAELGELAAIQEKIERWLEDGWVNNAMLYRFNEIIDKVEMESRIVHGREIQIAYMACAKWRALLAYTVERNAARQLKGDERTLVVREIHESVAGWLNRFAGKLRIPLWKTLYEIR